MFSDGFYIRVIYLMTCFIFGMQLAEFFGR
jgi:hypothetical protein